MRWKRRCPAVIKAEVNGRLQTIDHCYYEADEEHCHWSKEFGDTEDWIVPEGEVTKGKKYGTDRLKNVPRVDRSNQVLTSGEPVPDDRSHTALKPSGQQQDYVVLTESERHKGYVRRYRDAYRHLKCGKITTMSRAIAETYARDPYFYSGTFCMTCAGHFPVGEDGEFVWYEMDGTTGPKVGT